MKTAAVLLWTAALASAQVVFNNQTNSYTCIKAGSYCVGDSLKTDIIIRCSDALVPEAGRCEDELSGIPGGYNALCYQTSPDAGDAVCEKNCFAGSSQLPTSVCTPTASTTGVTTSTVAPGNVTTTLVETATTTYCPTTSIPWSTVTTPVGTGSPPPPSTNGTITSTVPITPTATPVKPSTTPGGTSTTLPTAGAAANRVGAALAGVGMVAAYFL